MAAAAEGETPGTGDLTVEIEEQATEEEDEAAEEAVTGTVMSVGSCLTLYFC
jgi:hypothetical protein